jgi:hypothetical protein
MCLISILNDSHYGNKFMSNKEIANYKEREARTTQDESFDIKKQAALTALSTIINGKKNDDDIKANQTMQKLQEEYRKICSLEPMKIDGKKDYFSINASAGGVTAKVSLVEKDATVKRLASIADCQNLEDYKTIQNNTFQLAGIIKLPKHGDILEVQREAIALAIARKLKLGNAIVTDSTMVNYNNEPALFVPFGKITSLKEIAEGEKQKQDLGLTGKTYQHYSTLNPVGEGIQPNTIVEDFGNTIAYFYLCGDPDAIGKDNQNKAITKGDKPNQLYLFDQVVMPKTRMKIDSRLKIQPTGFLRHSRHFQFRNRSLIEDNDFEARFNSLSKLQHKRKAINDLMDDIIDGYNVTINNINPHWYQVLSADDRKTFKQLKALKKDAQKLKKVLNQRIDALDKVLPKLNVPVNRFDKNQKEDKKTINEIKKGSVILETLLNKPTLYSNEGRPYRTPYTYRNKLSIKNIKIDNEDVATIEFNGKIDKTWLSHIRECHGSRDAMKIDLKRNGRSIKIPVDKLKDIQFKKVFPELSNKTDYDGVLDKDVLDINSLTQLKKCYEKDGVNDKGVDIVKQFTTNYDNAVTNQEKITCLKSARENLVNLKKATTNTGFINHVLRRFDLVAQNKLYDLLPDKNLKDKIGEAFDEAVKLDQVGIFHEVCQKAIAFGVDKKDKHQKRCYDILGEFFDKFTTDYKKTSLNDCLLIINQLNNDSKLYSGAIQVLKEEKQAIDNMQQSQPRSHLNNNNNENNVANLPLSNALSFKQGSAVISSNDGFDYKRKLKNPLPQIKVVSDEENANNNALLPDTLSLYL